MSPAERGPRSETTLHFSYGFEIEGVMSKELGDKLENRHHRLNLFHQDGSVRVAPPADFRAYERGNRNCSCGHCGDVVTEYSSPVFSTSNQILKELAEFEEKTQFIWDYSCGLHINIGCPDMNERQLKALATNFNFMSKIHSRALRWCKHQTYRLKKVNNYCQFPGDAEELLRLYKNDKKYSFCRLHPNGYLEFRFLAPCEHKLKNVIELLDIVTSYLKSNHKVRYHIQFDSEPKIERKNYKFNLHLNNALGRLVLNGTSKLDKLPPYIYYKKSRLWICNKLPKYSPMAATYGIELKTSQTTFAQEMQRRVRGEDSGLFLPDENTRKVYYRNFKSRELQMREQSCNSYGLLFDPTPIIISNREYVVTLRNDVVFNRPIPRRENTEFWENN